MERNGNGQERVAADCVLRMLPRWLTQSTAASAVQAGELSAMRGAVARAFHLGVKEAVAAGAIPPQLPEPRGTSVAVDVSG